MTAVALPDLDLARIRSAVDRIDLPFVDLPRIELDRLDLDAARRDLSRLRSAVEDDLARVELPRVDLPRVDLPRVDLPDLQQLLGRSSRSSLPRGPLLLGLAALVGGLALGGVLAFFLHPSQGARRRRGARRRLGRIARRVLG